MMVLVAVSVKFFQDVWNDTNPISQPSAELNEPEDVQNVTALDLHPDAATTWDPERVEIRELRNHVEEFTSRVDRLWGDLPSTDGNRRAPEPTVREESLSEESAR